MTDTKWMLKRGSLIYPTPIAIACGRVMRARTAAERVTATLKGAEVLARYLAAVAVASFASRGEQAGERKLSELKGNLAFGRFLALTQEVAASNVDHPMASMFAQGFRPQKKGKESVRGKADGALVELLELRNGDAHDLRNLDEAKALAIEERAAPLRMFLRALEGCEALLSTPLFVVEDQAWTKEAIVLRRLLLMGESADPTPEKLKVRDGGVSKIGVPYLALSQTCLHLPPWLLWGIDQSKQNFALLFLDAVEDKKVRYCTMDGTEQERGDDLVDTVRKLLAGERTEPETLVLLDGRSLAREWGETRSRLEEAGHRVEGLVDWSRFDQPTIAWYASRLAPGTADPHEAIREKLLDGRTSIEPEEHRQLRLLFGDRQTVRNELKRDVLDLRVVDPQSGRASERQLIQSDNLLKALQAAVPFFSRHTGMKEVAPDELGQATGSVDYLALREILVNQLIHQDYKDPTAAGQIDIQAGCVKVFNTGYSLVEQGKLLEGGKSQSRNPLIARALRAIGFAEVSGSGIRVVHRACLAARRRSPSFDSNEKANTFTLSLDWSTGEQQFDSYWKNFVGVPLNKDQAAVLSAIKDSPGITTSLLETATGFPLDALAKILDFLEFQVLIERDGSTLRLATQLQEKLG